MTTQPTNAAKPKRRWLRYSLRTMLIVITVFGVWLGAIVKQARDQKRAVEAIRALGGVFVYEHEQLNGTIEIIELKPTRGIIYDRTSGTSFTVEVPPPDSGEEMFPEATAGASQSVLLGAGEPFDRTSVESDAPQLALEPPKPWSRADWTAEQPVEENPTMGSWNIAHLKGRVPARPPGPKRPDPAKPPGPKWLRDWLGEEYFVTVVTVQFLGSLAKIELTDADLRHVSRLRNLRYLHLECTQITDAGLQHLKRLTKLEFLDVRGTQVTEEGVKKLQQALPDCEIVY